MAWVDAQTWGATVLICCIRFDIFQFYRPANEAAFSSTSQRDQQITQSATASGTIHLKYYFEPGVDSVRICISRHV